MFDRTQCRVRVYGAKRRAALRAYRYQYGRVYRYLQARRRLSRTLLARNHVEKLLQPTR